MTDVKLGETPDNPLVEGLERLPVHPTTLVIFGATGDLARRKLLPAIYNLAHEGALPERFNLVGSSRSEMSRRRVPRRRPPRRSGSSAAREPDETVLKELLANVRYVSGTFDEDSVYEALGEHLDGFDEDAGQPLNRAFYLSTAPEFFPVIIEQLGKHKLNRHEGAEVRAIIEKPFGTTLAEARELNHRVLSVFKERQVFRIDHYLGKETVQNLLAFRFANGLFEPVWNRNYIDHVQITAAEDLGDRHARRLLRQRRRAARPRPEPHAPAAVLRGDGAAGALRRPTRSATRRSRSCARSITPTAETVDAIAVRAQYTPGTVGGEDVTGYLEEDGVPRTPTPRPTRRCAWRSTTGAGPACRSTCAPASGWRAR